jgi:hypothetical protein
MQFTLINGWRLRRGKRIKEDVALYARLLAYTNEFREKLSKELNNG